MSRRFHSRSILFLLQLTAALFLPAAVWGQVADEPNTFRLAQTFEQAGKYEEALRYYQDLFSFRPENSAYFDGVRRCLMLLKKYDEAIAVISERLKRLPNDTHLLVLRGGAWLRKGNEAKAFDDWDTAISKAPHDTHVYIQISEEAVNGRLYDHAVEYLLRGRKTLRSPQLFVFEIARAYAMSMKFDRAMGEYIQYLLAAPSTVWQIQQYIAQFSEIPDALKSAQRITRQAADENSSNIAVRQLLAWLYMEEKNYFSAYEVYRDIDRLQKANGLELLQFAQRAFHDKAYRAALKAYQEIMERYPAAQYMPEAHFYRARTVESLSDEDELPEALSSGGVTDFPSSEAVVSYSGAVTLYEAVAKAYPSHPVAAESYYRIAYLKFTRFNDPDGALDILQKHNTMRKALTGRVDGDILVGDIYLAKGDADRALKQYESVLAMPQLQPGQRDEVRFNIAELFYFRGAFEKAVEILEPLAENNAMDITNDALALSLFIQQHSQPTDAPLKRYAYGMYLERQRKYSEAAAVMRDILEHHATSPMMDQTYLTLGRILLRMGRAGDAVQVFNECLDRYSDSVLRDQVLFALGRAYEEQTGEPVKAVETYQRLLNELPNSIHSGRARERILLLRKGNI